MSSFFVINIWNLEIVVEVYWIYIKLCGGKEHVSPSDVLPSITFVKFHFAHVRFISVLWDSKSPLSCLFLWIDFSWQPGLALTHGIGILWAVREQEEAGDGIGMCVWREMKPFQKLFIGLLWQQQARHLLM